MEIRTAIKQNFDSKEFAKVVALLEGIEFSDTSESNIDWIELNTMAAFSYSNLMNFERALYYSDRMISFYITQEKKDFDDDWLFSIALLKYQSLVNLGKYLQAYLFLRKDPTSVRDEIRKTIFYQKYSDDLTEKLVGRISIFLGVFAVLLSVLQFVFRILRPPVAIGAAVICMIILFLAFQKNARLIRAFVRKII